MSMIHSMTHQIMESIKDVPSIMMHVTVQQVSQNISVMLAHLLEYPNVHHHFWVNQYAPVTIV